MKPTKEQFKFFQKCCLEYADKFELNNWTFRFYFNKKNYDEKQGGWIIRNIHNSQADIYLDDKYDFEDIEDIRKTAKHEIIHCLIGQLYLLAISREGTYKEIDRIEEELVHKLEKLLK